MPRISTADSSDWLMMHDPLAVLHTEFLSCDIQHHRATRLRNRLADHVPAASRISTFICRTASLRPTNIARLTMA